MEEEKKLSAKEAAVFLGYKSATSYFYTLVRQNIIPSHKRPGRGKSGKGNRGGGLYFFEDELQKWLDLGRAR